MKEVYFDNQNTFYCLNKYSILLVNNKYKTILESNKNYTPRKPFFKSGKENYRTRNVEFEHIMPAENFGRQLSCWKEGGRKACKNDITFNEMEADMHNLVPLANIENNLFGFLLNNVNTLMSTEEIHLNVWKDKKMTLFTLRNIIRSIREKTYHDLTKNVSCRG